MDDAKRPFWHDSGGGAGHWRRRRRTVIYYRTGQKPIPRLVELACMGVELSGGADGKMVA